MLNKAVARRYAAAFFSLALEKGLVDSLERELAEVVKTVDENPDLQRFLDNPMVVVAEKKKVVDEVFGGRLSNLTLDFLKVVLDKRREAYLKDIYNEFVKRANEARNLVDVEVTSAKELSQADLTALEARLVKMTGKQVRLTTKVDPALIGGLVVRIGDRVIDGSVTKRLELLREALLQA